MHVATMISRDRELAAPDIIARPPSSPALRSASGVGVPALLDSAMRRYAAGDRSAFGALYEVLAPQLYRFCKRLSRRRDEAEDLFQDALLRLHRARASYRPGSPVLSWTFAIARSAFLDRARRRRRRPEHLVGADGVLSSLTSRDSSPESNASASVLLRVVDEAIGRMSEKNRSAYVLSQGEGFSVADAATVVGASGDVVKQRAHRATKQIRAALRDAGWDENAL